MPNIHITLLEGVTLEQKRAIAKRVNGVMMEELNVKNVNIEFAIVSRDNVAKNGILKCDA